MIITRASSGQIELLASSLLGDSKGSRDLAFHRRETNLVAATLIIEPRLYLGISPGLIWRHLNDDSDHRAILVDSEAVPRKAKLAHSCLRIRDRTNLNPTGHFDLYLCR